MRATLTLSMLIAIALPALSWGQQVLGFHEAQTAPRADWIAFSLQGETVWVNPDVSVTITSAPSAELRRRSPAAPFVQSMDPPGLQITFSEVDRARFADLTTKITGQRVAVLHRGQILAAPFVAEPIVGGHVVIYGIQDQSVAHNIVTRLCANHP